MSQTNSPVDKEETPSRYVVGIDLGTTNSAVAFFDTELPERKVQMFSIPQLVAPGEIEQRQTLPSFHYEPATGEFGAGAMQLPWQQEAHPYCVGFFARDHGGKVPGRLIASAKSWLCHTGVDRTAALLPWQGASDLQRLSPVEVTSRYLLHIREAWDHHFPKFPLADQEIVLTLPASFDEVARELTVKAAARAGLARIVLLEEPQAAFYAWIHKHEDDWQTRVEPGQKILVCDIGGGTTDFTLIRVRQTERGEVQFHRVAVGDHLILGGDNLDLTLAQFVEKRISPQKELSPLQWGVLVRACRGVKETLLGENPPDKEIVNLPGTGKRLIGGALQAEVTQEEVQQLLVEGFMPTVALESKPSTRRSGFQEFGLPYAADAAMTKYLAQFLTAHRYVDQTPEEAPQDFDPARPDVVLFNGGLFASPVLRQRWLDVMGAWFSQETDWQPHLLDHARLDQAVAQGAAYYGLVRRGEGVRIAAGLARTYYIGVQTQNTDQPTAVCLLPAGIEEGQEVHLDALDLELLVREPVEFPLFVSSLRLVDRPGELLPVDPEQMTALPPIRTVLSTRKASERGTVKVHLHAKLTEIGTLELWCAEVEGKRTWRLQFDVRAATQTDLTAHQGIAEQQGFLDEETIQACRSEIRETFAHQQKSQTADPKDLIQRLETATDVSRWKWPTSLLRELWELLMEVEAGRQLSPTHEARWLNLLGFALRPGYGLAVDDWRVNQTWKLFQSRKVLHPHCRIEYLILWRRIAGGLSPGQQQALADPLLALLRPQWKQSGNPSASSSGSSKGKRAKNPLAAKKSKPAKSKPKKAPTSVFGYGGHETSEAWRMLGAFELLPVPVKIDLGNLLQRLMPKEESAAVQAAHLWTLGRLGARIPLYGPLNAVVPLNVADAWAEAVLDLDQADRDHALCLMQLTRRTKDRYRDVSEKRREQVLRWFSRAGMEDHLTDLIREGGELQAEEQGQVFGESLPQGLRLG